MASVQSKYFQRLQQLVALPSISCTDAKFDMSNVAVVELLAHWCESLGFAVDIQYVDSDQSSQKKANLIASLGQGSGGLVLAGHTDTVPCDEALWQQDPFTLAEKNGRYYGLGATDMKGFFPVVLAAVEELVAEGVSSWRAPLILLATADEESSMSGARALGRRELGGASHAVIGEPTSLTPVRLHKGIMMEQIRVIGSSGHSSDPSLGANALEGMIDVMSALQHLRAQLQKEFTHQGFDLPTPTLNLGCIHGGDNPNRICGECALQFDLRPLPNMDIDELHERIAKEVNALKLAPGLSIQLERLFPGINAYEESEHSEIVKLAERFSEKNAESVSFATEAPFLKSLGLQTLVMGPGSIMQAHQPNEYIPQDSIKPGINIIRSLISSICL